MLSVFSTTKGNEDVHLLKKRIPQDLVSRSLAVMTISLGVVLGATFLLTMTEYTRHTDILALLFETTSAFGTVGMSMGLTPNLSSMGKYIIIVTMYIGRLGPLTLAFALAQKTVKQKYRYPEDKLLIG